MVVISQGPDLSGLQVFHATDPLLSNGSVLVFYGTSPTPNASVSSSARIQCHVFAAAGLQSYLKLVVSPVSSLYSAVECLPREEQGDEICRALAFTILKYFSELPEAAKSAWIQLALSSATRPAAELGLWGASHAANLARRMMPLEDPASVIRQVETALSTQSVSMLDLDLVLPSGSMSCLKQDHDLTAWNTEDADARYGQFYPLVKSFGEVVFIPTSKIRRAPSRPTALNRAATFSGAQRENVQREMNEFVETERRYVEKLSDLVNRVAVNFREKAVQRSSASSSPDYDALETLFPKSLSSMLSINSSFLQSLQTVLNDTGITADMNSSEHNSDRGTSALSGVADSTGALTFANLLVEWFPKFSDCYTDYIQAHSKFGPFLKYFAGDSQSTFAQRVHETGEQRLMSMLIEPVQRLPRYNLYVDNIVKQLPMGHPALKPFLKAKDIVSEICSQDGTGSPISKIPRIKQLIPSWPSTCSPPGRFILAVDAIELRSPYDDNLPSCRSQEFLFVLFPGYLILLQKLGKSPMSARSFTVESENSNTLPKSHVGAENMKDNGLVFSHWATLSELSFCETGSDRMIRWTPSKARAAGALRTPSDGSIRTFLLQGAYEGKASRWTKEVVKARMEGRFSEAERESKIWEPRLLESDRQDLGLITAVFEEGESQHASIRGEPGSVRVVMNQTKDAQSLKPGQMGIDVVASVSPKGEGFFWLEVEAVNEKGTRDLTTEADFLPILTKRLSSLLQMRSKVRNPNLSAYLLQHHSSILHSLNLAVESNSSGNTDTQAKRPQSPVKLLSNLFGSKSLRDYGSSKAQKSSTKTLGKIPNFQAPSQETASSSPHTKEKENSPKSIATLLGNESKELPMEPIQLLEQTFSCFMIALRARKGNVIGAVIARRNMSDEAAVNELYNTLLEDSGNYEKAAQAPVDVLFAAFEKFLKVAWRETLGAVISGAMLGDLQTKLEILNPFDADEYAEKGLSELAPQNRRAFSDIIELLVDLLDGMRNDGDRGMLTAAFAEIVVCDDDPHTFIPLFDRFVEDHEVLSPQRPISQGALSGFASTASSITRSTKAGSISSKASSLSKRLGFGSLRKENSRTESPMLGSVARFGSKKPLPPEPGLEKPGLGRAKSIDLTSQLTALRRPGSRDRPIAFGTSEGSRPGTSHSTDQAETTMSSRESSPAKRSAVLRKKRRSSLSDLNSLQTPSASPFWTTSASKQVEGILLPSLTPNNLSDTPSRATFVRPISPIRKENVAPISLLSDAGTAAKAKEISPLRSMNTLKNVPSAYASQQDNQDLPSATQSGPSVPRGILSERASSGNTPLPLNISPNKVNENASPIKSTEIISPSKASDNLSPKKLRVQSPAKLRERLQGHQQAVEGANSTLQIELAKIGEEIAAMNGRPVPPPKPDQHQSPQKKETAPPEVFNLSTRLKALESKVTHLTRNLSDRSAAIETDLASSLHASEKKAKKLDSELQFANAENEALYDRMNEETMKVFEQVRSENGVEELRQQLRESQTEAAKWRKEATRLKRENTSLRSELSTL